MKDDECGYDGIPGCMSGLSRSEGMQFNSRMKAAANHSTEDKNQFPFPGHTGFIWQSGLTNRSLL